MIDRAALYQETNGKEFWNELKSFLEWLDNDHGIVLKPFYNNTSIDIDALVLDYFGINPQNKIEELDNGDKSQAL